jgi:uncharacterized protein (TIRG00374 family)
MRASKRLRWSVVGFALITGLYLGALVWGDSQKEVKGSLDLVVDLAPFLVSATLLSYLVRFFRWYWLLSRAGYRVASVTAFVAYLSGFAYTATPGKVGELIRVRHFKQLGVPAEITLAAFIFERSFDLIAVLLLSLFIIHEPKMILFAAGFVVVLLSCIIGCMAKPGILGRFERLCLRMKLSPAARLVRVLQGGVLGCRTWLNMRDIGVSLFAALLAWGIVAGGFVYLQREITDVVPLSEAFSIYPLSMLIGAASMIPGGIGSTEGAIVFLLGGYDVALGSAVKIAVGIRLTTLWFGILIGFVSLGVLEWRFNKAQGKSAEC